MCFLMLLMIAHLSSANPILPTGTWVNITPPVTNGTTLYVSDIQFDHKNPSILYCCDVIDQRLKKSTDGGSTWAILGANGGAQLQGAFRIRIDPNYSKRLYLINGIRGTGFFVSNDAGATWTTPAGWTKLMDTIHEDDLYNIAVDPTDFNHVLISFYLLWDPVNWYPYSGNAGVVESFDGCNTWVIHQPRAEWSTDHCYNVAFLYDPIHGQGDGKTWIFTNRASGIWRTSNSGTSWNQVSSTIQVTRSQYYYAKTGVLYGAANSYPIRSTDNGVTWSSITKGCVYSVYYCMQGDGNTLYTLPDAGGPILVSAEDDGLNWHAFNSQTFPEGGNVFTYDSAGHIMYVAAKSGGLWALKVSASSTSLRQADRPAAGKLSPGQSGRALNFFRSGLAVTVDNCQYRIDGTRSLSKSSRFHVR
jgi:photosystem II stability/assembly factor-like uncharacterized protein